jgi:hypothetical protein
MSSVHHTSAVDVFILSDWWRELVLKMCKYGQDFTCSGRHHSKCVIGKETCTSFILSHVT